MNDFAEFLKILGKGPKSRRSLTEDEAFNAAVMMFNGQVTDRQLGAFLLLLRANGETKDELIGILKATRSTFLSQFTRPAGLDIEFSAYAGKWRYPPYYLLAAKLLAQQGYGVLIHGDQGQFNHRHYATDFLESFDIAQASSLKDAYETLQTPQFLYLPLAHFAQPLREILHLKDELGVRTLFNTLVKVLNPLNAPVSMQSIFHRGVEQLHLHAATALNNHCTCIFKGEGGDPEIRPDALTHLYMLKKNTLIEPELNGLIERQVRPETWSMDSLLGLWHGKACDNYGESAVVATVAVALMGLNDTLSYEQGVQLAKTYWKSRHDH